MKDDLCLGCAPSQQLEHFAPSVRVLIARSVCGCGSPARSRLRVRWSWDRKSGTRTTPKSRRSQRTVPLNPELAGELERLGKSSLGENFDPDRHADALVFADLQTGLPMVESQVRRRYKLARA